MGRIMKWWCRLTVRWWTPGSCTSKAPQFLLTSEISKGTKPTPSLAPRQQPQRRPMSSAPSLNHYSRTSQLHWKAKSEPLSNPGAGEESCPLLLGSKQKTTSYYSSERNKQLLFFSPSTHLLESTGIYILENVSLVAGAASVFRVVCCRLFALPFLTRVPAVFVLCFQSCSFK